MMINVVIDVSTWSEILSLIDDGNDYERQPVYITPIPQYGQEP
jgi:hypothetical protein